MATEGAAETVTTTPIDLHTDDPGEWHDFVMPGSDRPVRLRRLYVDDRTKASVSAVRFPPGWHRAATGHYLAAEEFLVLEGAINVVRRHSAGDYVYLPPRTVRVDTASPDGALVVAYFSAPPQWIDGAPQTPPPQEPTFGPPTGIMRDNAPEVTGGCRAVPELGSEPLPVDSDIIWLADSTWEWVPAGAVPRGAGAALVRRWA